MQNNPDNNFCYNCGELLHGKFCHTCGEKKISREDLTVRKFFDQFVDVFTHFDSKILRSVRLLVTKPGLLPVEYIRGKRVIYSKPAQLFFLINIVYFFVLNYIGFDTFTDPLEDQMNHFIYGGIVTSMINSKLSDGHISFQEYSTKFYDTIYVHSKLLIILMIPMLAGFLMLIYRKQKKLYFEHLVFSTYLFSFILLFYTFFINSLYYLVYFSSEFLTGNNSGYSFDEVFVSLIVITALAIYLYFAVKRSYKETNKSAVFKTVIIVFGMILISVVYDFILFLTVFWSMG